MTLRHRGAAAEFSPSTSRDRGVKEGEAAVAGRTGVVKEARELLA